MCQPRANSRGWTRPLARRYGLISFVVVLACLPEYVGILAAAGPEALRVTANFRALEAVAPNARLELHTSRPLLHGEGELAVLVGETDVTALCVNNNNSLTYTPKAIPLPVGETSVTVYLISENNSWTEIARLPLLVAEPKRTSAKGNELHTSASNPATTNTEKAEGPAPFQFTPSVAVNVKGQSTALFFPDSNRPARLNFTDVTVQASLQGNYTHGSLVAQNQFDLAGSSVQKEALRFGELGTRAMQLDLSSYLIQYQFRRARLNLGSVSFGTNRQLINSFSSRGVMFTLPLNKRFDVSAAAMNGTSIVGFNNFLGPTRRNHEVLSAALGMELITKRPGGFRIEVGTLKGSLLPLNNFNQTSVNDAERSYGGSIRVIASDVAQHFHLDGGFARSRFTNPKDPLLYQGRDVVAVRAVTRNARYLDVSYDLLHGYKLDEKRTINLSVAYHHEKVDPLYRTVAASPQADRLNNQWDITGSIGEITLAFDHTRADDNLADIHSILKTLTRRYAFNLAAPAAALVGNSSKSPWLPRLSYSFDRLHQFAAFVPVNGDFQSTSQIPDQISTNQSFSAEWQLPRTVRLGYRFNHSFQDNRQIGPERADLLNETNGLTFGMNPLKTLDLNFDVNAERSSNFEQNSSNSTLRFGTSLTWRMTRSMAWAITVSTTGAGDRANINHRRDADLDIQYSWRFLATEKNRWKKMQGQFFVRYANSYATARDRLFGFHTFTKLQTFNAGVSFVFF